jgi:hypothetical protein
MSRSVTCALLAGAAWLIGGQALGDDSRLHRYELPNLDTLELKLPTGWVDSVDVPPGGGAMTILLAPAQGPPFEIHVTPQWSEPDDPVLMDAAQLHEAVRESAERSKPQAVEQDIEIRRLQGQSGIGFHFSVTDRAPQPEEFLHMAQGGLQTGELILWFTILTHDGQASVVADALAMLRSAVHRDRTGCRRSGADARSH